ncbi:unnamed protein product [Amoebophrya sp. A120]|nr:unnamed protein product [Amoebophrya sp. A120]|eukprot:GSA120T00012385001.1
MLRVLSVLKMLSSTPSLAGFLVLHLLQAPAPLGAIASGRAASGGVAEPVSLRDLFDLRQRLRERLLKDQRQAQAASAKQPARSSPGPESESGAWFMSSLNLQPPSKRKSIGTPPTPSTAPSPVTGPAPDRDMLPQGGEKPEPIEALQKSSECESGTKSSSKKDGGHDVKLLHPKPTTHFAWKKRNGRTRRGTGGRPKFGHSACSESGSESGSTSDSAESSSGGTSSGHMSSCDEVPAPRLEGRSSASGNNYQGPAPKDNPHMISKHVPVYFASHVSENNEPSKSDPRNARLGPAGTANMLRDMILLSHPVPVQDRLLSESHFLTASSTLSGRDNSGDPRNAGLGPQGTQAMLHFYKTISGTGREAGSAAAAGSAQEDARAAAPPKAAGKGTQAPGAKKQPHSSYNAEFCVYYHLLAHDVGQQTQRAAMVSETFVEQPEVEVAGLFDAPTLHLPGRSSSGEQVVDEELFNTHLYQPLIRAARRVYDHCLNRNSNCKARVRDSDSKADSRHWQASKTYAVKKQKMQNFFRINVAAPDAATFQSAVLRMTQELRDIIAPPAGNKIIRLRTYNVRLNLPRSEFLADSAFCWDGDQNPLHALVLEWVFPTKLVRETGAWSRAGSEPLRKLIRTFELGSKPATLVLHDARSEDPSMMRAGGPRQTARGSDRGGGAAGTIPPQRGAPAPAPRHEVFTYLCEMWPTPGNMTCASRPGYIKVGIQFNEAVRVADQHLFL